MNDLTLLPSMHTLAELRKLHGKTLRDIAEYVGVSATLVSRWERFAATPIETHRDSLATLFGVDVEHIRWVPRYQDTEDDEGEVQHPVQGRLHKTDRGRSFIEMPDGKVLW